MVNIRATVRAARAAEVIDAKQGDAMIAFAKSLYYGDRNWKRILANPKFEQNDGFSAWLKANEVDQKQRDALALIDKMIKGDVLTPSVVHVEPFQFEHTRLWDSAIQHWEAAARPKDSRGSGIQLLGDDQLSF
jgi:hypothetical protein